MENKCEKNIFESGFDSFELDDEFFNGLDFDFKKNNSNEKLSVSKDRTIDGKRGKSKNTFEVKAQRCESLFVDDSDDSDFFDFRSKEKKQSLKVQNDSKKKGSNRLSNNGFISYLSPIHGEKCSKSISKRLNLSSSTPERSNHESGAKEKVKPSENSVRNPDYAYLEDVLFDDWDIDENKKKDEENERVTLSQAMKLLEEAESERRSDQESLNGSIDLLTGEVVNASLGVLFEESFGLPESTKKNVVKESSDESVIVEAVKIVSKPPAAQKLNFESEKVNPEKTGADKEESKDFYFSSDEDFIFCSPDLLKEAKQAIKRTKENAKLVKRDSVSPTKDSDLNESSDIVNATFLKKRPKRFKVIESDTAEDSPSPKFLRQNKTVSKKRRSSRGNLGREFLDLEAEMSDSLDVSSDEAEEDGEFDESFVDEASYLTQNCAANMTAKYLESVKSVNRLGTFKIPAPKPYNPVNVFSQIPEESNSDYEIDSFCIKDVEEEEPKSDLSDLEIAEKILEMDRRKRKKKRNGKLRKF